jgi:hypothetical protein
MFLLASCSKIGSDQSEVIIIDDEHKTAAKNEIVITDNSFGGEQGAFTAAKTVSQETAKIAADQSRINVMYDGFGNKTETRTFNNHLRLQCVMIKTAVDGQKQIFVYGQNGQVNPLPENMVDKAMTAPADEIANSAGIFQTYRQPSPVAQSIQSRNNTPLQPMPSYNFPVQNRPVEQTPSEEENTPVAPTSEKSVENKDTPSTISPNKEQ